MLALAGARTTERMPSKEEFADRFRQVFKDLLQAGVPDIPTAKYMHLIPLTKPDKHSGQ